MSDTKKHLENIIRIAIEANNEVVQELYNNSYKTMLLLDSMEGLGYIRPEIDQDCSVKTLIELEQSTNDEHAQLPKKFTKKYLEIAKNCTVLGIPLDELSKDELKAGIALQDGRQEKRLEKKIGKKCLTLRRLAYLKMRQGNYCFWGFPDE